jgi:hypothetical protein
MTGMGSSRAMRRIEFLIRLGLISGPGRTRVASADRAWILFLKAS